MNRVRNINLSAMVINMCYPQCRGFFIWSPHFILNFLWHPGMLDTDFSYVQIKSFCWVDWSIEVSIIVALLFITHGNWASKWKIWTALVYICFGEELFLIQPIIKSTRSERERKRHLAEVKAEWQRNIIWSNFTLNNDNYYGLMLKFIKIKTC